MLIRSSDERWTMMNKMIMTNKFKIINSNVIASASDSGEEFEEGSCFLKGGLNCSSLEHDCETCLQKKYDRVKSWIV